MATLDPEVVAANARLPLLLLVAGLASACVASAARSWGQFALAAVLGPGHAACCFAAASALLWRTRHSGLRGGGFASAGLAAALAAEAVACFGELGPPLSLSAASPAGEHAAGASALLHSMAVAPAGLALRALSRALYAAASARWLGEIRPVSWSSATAMCTIPAAALVGCAQLAIDDSAAASLAAHAGAEPGCAPLEQDPHYGGLALDAAGAAALVGACTLRVATAWLAPRASRARAPPGGGAAAAALVPASHAIDEARQLRAKLGALLPLALAAALALVAALGRLRFSAVGLTDPADGASGLGGSAAWASALERADWEAWVRLSLVLLDAAVALVVVWCARAAARPLRSLWLRPSLPPERA